MLELTPRAQTRSLMLSEIETYLTTLEDWERWKDFFESSTGKTLIDILTGIAELLIYKLEVRSLDSYLHTALSKSAVYLLAHMVGYNPNRKSHGHGVVRIRFRVPPPMDLVLPEGFEFDHDIPLVCAENIHIPKNTSELLIPVIQGKWMTQVFSRAENNLIGKDWESIVVNSGEFNIDQYKIYVEVDNALVELVHRIEKVTPNSVIARTDYRGGVILLFGDGVFGLRLRSSSVVRVKYLFTQGQDGLVPVNKDLGTYSIGNYIFDAIVHSAVQGGSNEDSISKVKYLASRFFQTQGRAVTAYDYQAITMSYPGVISAQVVRDDDQCCTVLISALKDVAISQNLYTWSRPEIDDLLAYLEDYKMLSSRLIFVQPEALDLDLHITVVVPPLFESSDLDGKIWQYIVDTYCYQLQGRFLSTKVIDNITDNHPGVKRSYLRVNESLEYPDIELDFNEFFRPGVITISRQVEV